MDPTGWATGLVAVAAAMIGGTIEHLWSAARARRGEVEQATNELLRVMPTAVASLSTTVTESALATNAKWRQAVTEATDLIALIRLPGVAVIGGRRDPALLEPGERLAGTRGGVHVDPSLGEPTLRPRWDS